MFANRLMNCSEAMVTTPAFTDISKISKDFCEKRGCDAPTLLLRYAPAAGHCRKIMTLFLRLKAEPRGVVSGFLQ